MSFFVAILIVSTLTITLVEAFVNIDEGFSSDAGESSLLQYLLIRIPSYYLRELLPISAFAAAFFSVAISVQRSEWLAVQAAGIPAWRMVVPIALAGLGIASLAFLLGEAVMTRATSQYALYQTTDKSEQVFDGSRYWHRSGDDLYRIKGADPERRTLGRVEIFRRSPKGRLLSITYLRNVRVTPDGSWHAKNATLREFDPDHPEERPTVQHGLTLELPAMSEALDWLVFSEPEALTVPELNHHIQRSVGQDGIRAQKLRRHLQTFLHQRLTDPVIIVMLTLIAIPFALRVQPGGNMVWAAVMGLAVIVSFFFLRSLLQGLVLKGILPPVTTAWLLPVAMTAGTLIALSRSSQPR